MDPHALQAIITTLLLMQMQNPNGLALKPEHLKQEGIAQKQQILRNAKKTSREQRICEPVKITQVKQPRQNILKPDLRYRKRSIRTKPRSSHK